MRIGSKEPAFGKGPYRSLCSVLLRNGQLVPARVVLKVVWREDGHVHSHDADRSDHQRQKLEVRRPPSRERADTVQLSSERRERAHAEKPEHEWTCREEGSPELAQEPDDE